MSHPQNPMVDAAAKQLIDLTERLGAHNYHPLPIVIHEASGVWVEDTAGHRYLDMLSAYSALNQGHRHPRIIQALVNQANKVTITSRAFHNELLGPFYERLTQMTGKDMVLPMNTGAEAVETAIKAARRWAYIEKGVPNQQAEIIVCEGNFHGRTITTVSMSSSEEYQRGFGPLTPGFKIVPYGDLAALEQAITANTAAFLVEPIQGEAGIVIPPSGYLTQAAKLCQTRQVLFMADEIQTGLGRTGKMFACDWESVVPDVYILGKALSGGVLPVSAVVANHDILGVFQPGSHGSTFGGNPLACAVAIAALDVIVEEDLAQRSQDLGSAFLERLHSLPHPPIKEIRGRGLFIGLELDEPARPYCEQLLAQGLLCKETHENVIRLAPPLVISQSELDQAFQAIEFVLAKAPVLAR